MTQAPHADFLEEGPFESLSFSTAVGDVESHVNENLRRAGNLLGVAPAHILYLSQVHGREARFFTEPAGLIIDYRLPDGNGLGVARALREAGFKGHAILITAFPSRELSAQARAEGFARVFEKPLPHRVLVQAVAELSR